MDEQGGHLGEAAIHGQLQGRASLSVFDVDVSAGIQEKFYAFRDALIAGIKDCGRKHGHAAVVAYFRIRAAVDKI